MEDFPVLCRRLRRLPLRQLAVAVQLELQVNGFKYFLLP